MSNSSGRQSRSERNEMRHLRKQGTSVVCSMLRNSVSLATIKTKTTTNRDNCLYQGSYNESMQKNKWVNLVNSTSEDMATMVENNVDDWEYDEFPGWKRWKFAFGCQLIREVQNSHHSFWGAFISTRVWVRWIYVVARECLFFMVILTFYLKTSVTGSLWVHCVWPITKWERPSLESNLLFLIIRFQFK